MIRSQACAKYDSGVLASRIRIGLGLKVLQQQGELKSSHLASLGDSPLVYSALRLLLGCRSNTNGMSHSYGKYALVVTVLLREAEILIYVLGARVLSGPSHTPTRSH
jgi:hypothetical protein